MAFYVLKYFRPNPARPIRPTPNKNMLAGSGIRIMTIVRSLFD
jgi:hypothetical protein